MGARSLIVIALVLAALSLAVTASNADECLSRAEDWQLQRVTVSVAGVPKAAAVDRAIVVTISATGQIIIRRDSSEQVEWFRP